MASGDMSGFFGLCVSVIGFIVQSQLFEIEQVFSATSELFEQFESRPRHHRDSLPRVFNDSTVVPSQLHFLGGKHQIQCEQRFPDDLGNEDDLPFRNLNEMGRVPGFSNPQAIAQLGSYFTVRSLCFEIHVTANVGGTKREYVAIVRQNNTRDVPTLNLYWK